VNTIPDAPICGSGNLTVAFDRDHHQVCYHLSKSDFWHVIPMSHMLFQKTHVR